MKTSEYLEDWADEVEDRPHYKGGLGDWMQPGGPACMVGSELAMRRDKLGPGLGFVPPDLYAAVMDASSSAYTFVYGVIGARSIGAWNDTEERTKQNVVDVLRKAAKIALREEEGLDPE